MMVIKYKKLHDPGSYGLVFILPTSSEQTDGQYYTKIGPF
jgi:hypothetical protein